MNLGGADLRGADLSHATLLGTDFSKAKLHATDFTAAGAWSTQFSDLDLSAAKGLETIVHYGPSSIGIDTIYKSRGKIPEGFLRVFTGNPPVLVTTPRHQHLLVSVCLLRIVPPSLVCLRLTSLCRILIAPLPFTRKTSGYH